MAKNPNEKGFRDCLTVVSGQKIKYTNEFFLSELAKWSMQTQYGTVWMKIRAHY